MNLIDVKNLLFKYKMYSGEKEEVLSLIHISEPTRLVHSSRMPSSA